MRTILAGVLAGVAMFIWSGIANLALPIGTTGVSRAPDEAQVQAALHAALGERSGLYVVPYSAMTAKAPSGPAAVVEYLGRGEPFGITPAKLATEFAVELVMAVLAAILLSLTRLSGFVPRVAFVLALGVFAAVMTNASNMIWFAFPADYTLGYAFILLVGYLVAGVVIAAVVRPGVRGLSPA
jgi:hypothetical protein